MSPKALKLLVAGLLVMVAGLLFTIRRLSQQIEGRSAETGATLAQQAPATPPTAAAQPAPASAGDPAPAAAAVPSPEPRRLTPIQTHRAVTRPRAQAVAAEPAPAVTPVTVTESRPAPPAVVPAAAPAPDPVPEPRVETPRVPPAPRRVTIPAGTTLHVRTQNTLSTERNLKGDTFIATLEQPLVVEGLVIAERGSEVEGQVVRAEKAGRVEGLSDLAVELVRLRTSDGQRVPLATDLHEIQGQRSRGSDAKKVGVGAGLGAIIGAIAGGGRGAAIGAGAGGAAGGGAVLATRGQPAVIPSESRLTFHTRTPVDVTERR